MENNREIIRILMQAIQIQNPITSGSGLVPLKDSIWTPEELKLLKHFLFTLLKHEAGVEEAGTKS